MMLHLQPSRQNQGVMQAAIGSKHCGIQALLEKS